MLFLCPISLSNRRCSHFICCDNMFSSTLRDCSSNKLPFIICSCCYYPHSYCCSKKRERREKKRKTAELVIRIEEISAFFFLFSSRCVSRSRLLYVLSFLTVKHLRMLFGSVHDILSMEKGRLR